MHLRRISNNVTEIVTNTGNVVLFSYDVPVAAYLNNGRGFIRTNKHYSKTTSKHINQWLKGQVERNPRRADRNAREA